MLTQSQIQYIKTAAFRLNSRKASITIDQPLLLAQLQMHELETIKKIAEIIDPTKEVESYDIEDTGSGKKVNYSLIDPAQRDKPNYDRETPAIRDNVPDIDLDEVSYDDVVAPYKQMVAPEESVETDKQLAKTQRRQRQQRLTYLTKKNLTKPLKGKDYKELVDLSREFLPENKFNEIFGDVSEETFEDSDSDIADLSDEEIQKRIKEYQEITGKKPEPSPFYAGTTDNEMIGENGEIIQSVDPENKNVEDITPEQDESGGTGDSDYDEALYQITNLLHSLPDDVIKNNVDFSSSTPITDFIRKDSMESDDFKADIISIAKEYGVSPKDLLFGLDQTAGEYYKGISETRDTLKPFMQELRDNSNLLNPDKAVPPKSPEEVQDSLKKFKEKFNLGKGQSEDSSNTSVNTPKEEKSDTGADKAFDALFSSVIKALAAKQAKNEPITKDALQKFLFKNPQIAGFLTKHNKSLADFAEYLKATGKVQDILKYITNAA